MVKKKKTLKRIDIPTGRAYMLEDESIVSINNYTRNKLQSLLFNKYNVVEYMNESKDNFFKIIQLII